MGIAVMFTVLKGESKLKIGNRKKYRDENKRLVFFMRFKSFEAEKKYIEKQREKGIILKSS